MSSLLREPREDAPLLGSSQRQPRGAADEDEVVTFVPGDPGDPRNWPAARKWLMIAAIMPIDLSDMDISSATATLGLSMYILGLAFGPMSLAPLSECYGRRPIYIVSYGIFLVLLLLSSFAPNLSIFLVFRVFSGYFSSVTISNFGGTIADLFHHHDTGPAMSLFLWAATGGSPTGFVLFSLIADGRSWQAVFRIMLVICFAFWVTLTGALFYLGETRHSVLLVRRANALRKSTGNEELHVPEEAKQRGPRQLFGTILARPFRFLATEAIVQFAALYNGYLYGLSFLFNGAFHFIFGPGGYGFSVTGVGLSFLGIVVGITVGLVTNMYQERYYQREVAVSPNHDVPEARVHLANVAAVVLPISLFAFAFTADSDFHYIVPILASTFWGWSFYTLILMTLTYTEDAYMTYSASALAGIGLIRNLAGAGFPLVGRGLFVNKRTKTATIILGAMSVSLLPIPFVLGRFGKTLRRKSPWAAQHARDDS